MLILPQIYDFHPTIGRLELDVKYTTHNGSIVTLVAYIDVDGASQSVYLGDNNRWYFYNGRCHWYDHSDDYDLFEKVIDIPEEGYYWLKPTLVFVPSHPPEIVRLVHTDKGPVIYKFQTNDPYRVYQKSCPHPNDGINVDQLLKKIDYPDE